ncbi:MAG: ATP-binding protein [Patescibacteria group bacterium]
MSAFSLSSLILSLTTILFSVVAFQSDRENKVNRYWFYFSIPFAAWSMALYFLTSASTAESAFKWQYILDASAVWIPSTYFAFVATLLRYKKTYTRTILYIVSFAMAILSFSPLFKVGMVQKFDFFWINPGPLYILFPIFFASTVILSVFHIWNTLKKIEPGSTYRSQLKNTLIVCLIGFTAGGTNFFPQFFNIYPFGNYIVILYIIVMVYGVIRYKVLSPKVVTAQLFTSALILISFIEIILSEGVSQITFKIVIFIFVAIFSWLFIKSVKVEIKTKEELQKSSELLVKKNAELHRISEEKSEFVSLASHQIRGPLTSIKGYISLLRDEDLGPVSKEAKEALGVMELSCTTLASVVNDYLDVTRIEQGRMHYDFVNLDLRELLRECMTELAPSFERSGLACVDNIPKTDEGGLFNVRADRTKLKQVIMNIIDNSIKYTPKGSITITACRKTDGIVRVEVSDTGVGISAEVMPKLFVKFSRAPDASQANILGTGLGLFIAKSFVEAHEGHLWAESAGEGKGSTFIIELKGM